MYKKLGGQAAKYAYAVQLCQRVFKGGLSKTCIPFSPRRSELVNSVLLTKQAALVNDFIAYSHHHVAHARNLTAGF
jgi:hypothetical protein